MTTLDPQIEATDDPEWERLHEAALPGSPTDLPTFGCERPGWVRLTGLASTSMGLPIPPPVLVVGGSGGAGVTTTALGLASSIAVENSGEVWPTVVDATPEGGDLALRGADAFRGLATVQSWLSSDRPGLPSTVDAACGRASSGARVMARGDGPLPRRETFVSVRRHLCEAGWVPIFDGGAPVSSRLVRPLLADPCIPVVLVVAARADAANRLVPVLQWLDGEFGTCGMGEVTIVVTRQHHLDTSDIASHLRAYLDGWIRGLVDVPYDQHLASGGPLVWEQVSSPVRDAYRTIAQSLVIPTRTNVKEM